MKNIYKVLSIMFAVSIITGFTYGQNPRITWETKGWSHGIAEAVTYKTSAGKQYVVLSRPEAGNAWVIALDADGQMGGITWSTNKWYKGITALATYEQNGVNYLAISCSDNGNFWIMRLTDDGKVDETSLTHIKNWPPGITEINTFDIDGKDYLFMVKGETGEAWVFTIGEGGKLGNYIWYTKDYEKGICASATYDVDGNDFLFLSNPANGHAWIIELTKEGKPGQFFWKTTKWHKGISAVSVMKTGNTPYLILSAPADGSAWSFKLDDGGKKPVHAWSGKWVPGIQGLASYTENGIGYAVLTNPTNSRAWILTKFHKTENNLSAIDGSGVTNPELKNVLNKIDAVYSKTVSVENNLHGLNNKCGGARNSVNEAYDVSNSLKSVNERVGRITQVAGVLKRIPVIGIAVTGATATVDMINDKTGSLASGMENLDKPLFQPIKNNIHETFSASNRLESSLMALSEKLKNYKKQIVTASPEAQNSLAAKSSIIISNLSSIESELAAIEMEAGQLQQKADRVSKIDKPVAKLRNSMDDINDKLSKSDKAFNEVDKVLNKSFKKQVGPVKINISLRKVLEGGKVGKVFRKFVDPWVKKGVSKITKKLKIPMPKIPSIDEVKRDFEQFKTAAADMLDNSKKLQTCCQNISKADAAMAKEFASVNVSSVN